MSANGICRVSFSSERLVRDCKRALAGLVMFAGLSMLAHCGSGCNAIQAPTTLEQSYTTEIVACAATAGYPGAYDEQADRRCRADVNCRYGLGACADGGVADGH